MRAMLPRWPVCSASLPESTSARSSSASTDLVAVLLIVFIEAQSAVEAASPWSVPPAAVVSSPSPGGTHAPGHAAEHVHAPVHVRLHDTGPTAPPLVWACCSLQVLHNIMKKGASSNYLYFDGKYYGSEKEFKASVPMADKPCLLV